VQVGDSRDAATGLAQTGVIQGDDEHVAGDDQTALENRLEDIAGPPRRAEKKR
jgi:hypothetical protein